MDASDVDVHPMEFQETFDHITAAVTKILDAGAVPVMMDGNHSDTQLWNGFANRIDTSHSSPQGA